VARVLPVFNRIWNYAGADILKESRRAHLSLLQPAIRHLQPAAVEQGDLAGLWVRAGGTAGN
jgi:hypothetical protein